MLGRAVLGGAGLDVLAASLGAASETAPVDSTVHAWPSTEWANAVVLGAMATYSAPFQAIDDAANVERPLPVVHDVPLFEVYSVVPPLLMITKCAESEHETPVHGALVVSAEESDVQADTPPVVERATLEPPGVKASVVPEQDASKFAATPTITPL